MTNPRGTKPAAAMPRRGFLQLAPALGLGAAELLRTQAYAQASAQTPQATASPMRITLLGTGTPAPSIKRKSSGYLIEIGSDVILLDGGPGTQHRMLEAGVQPTQVTHVFYSHLHYDHFFEYPLLVLQRWDMGAARIPELKVHGPAPIARVTERLIGENGAFSPDLHARTHHQASLDTYVARGGQLPRRRPAPIVREMSPGDVVEADGWRMRIGRAVHFQPYLNCLTHRLEAGGASLFYTGDSGYGRELVELARDCDVLIAMCHFYTGTEPTAEYRRATGNHMDVARLAADAGAKLLVLSHMLELLDRPGVKERMLVDIATIYQGPVIIGEDLMRIPLQVALPRRLEP